jgi:hypothetical protein
MKVPIAASSPAAAPANASVSRIRSDRRFRRTALTLDARGWSGLSRACLRPLAQVDRIEEAAKERIERNPHSGETNDVALVMMLFDSARLAVANADDPVAERHLDGEDRESEREAPRRAGTAPDPDLAGGLWTGQPDACPGVEGWHPYRPGTDLRSPTPRCRLRRPVADHPLWVMRQPP